MTGFLSLVAAILAISVLIIIHEAGHYVAARLAGMRVERFSFGFGPVLLSFRRGDTLFAISAVPIGGYVSVAGAATASESSDDPGAYVNKSAPRRFGFVLAGPVMNWVTAVAVAWALLATVGLGVADPSARVGELVPGMPAEAAGLRPGDRIEAVAGASVATFLDVVKAVQPHPGEQITFEVVRGEGADAQRLALPITPRADGGVGKIGLYPAEVVLRTGGLRALVEGVRLTNANVAMQLRGFGAIFSRGQKLDNVEGPIGIARRLVSGARAGTEKFLVLVWNISVGLAVLNLLPFPALDGSRLVFLAYEIVTRRKVNERVEGIIHMAGFVVLLLLIVAVSFGDVRRLLR